VEQRFEWDEGKRLGNIKKHGIDFVRMRRMFDGRPIVNFNADRSGEQRTATVSEIEFKLYTVIWTGREGSIRMISARRARSAEERAYRALHRR